MAEFCNDCAKKLGFPPENHHGLCEGCGRVVKAEYQDKYIILGLILIAFFVLLCLKK